jgi:aldehyde dehydrogenase (NAD+)
MHNVVNPATEEVIGKVVLGSSADVDAAVTAARKAFPAWSTLPVEERCAYIDKFCVIYQTKLEEMAQTISSEMGAPLWIASKSFWKQEQGY